MFEQGAQSDAGWQFGTRVLVVVETCRGVPTRQSLDLVAAAAGSELANHGSVIAVSLHRFSDAVQEMLRSRGCGHLLVPARESVSSIHAPDEWTHFLSMLVPQCERALVLLPHSLLGCEVGARVAFRIGCPVLINCESVTLRGDDVTVSRACFGARLEEEVKIHAPLTVLTVAGNASFSAEAVDVRNCDDNWIVEEVEYELANSPSKIECIRREVESELPGPSLETANVVVGGGRGLEGPQGFAELSRLAAKLGGAPGASRVACDLAWCPKSWQIGLSGRSIRADWYIAFGISGASHHMAGCARVVNLVAVNRDSSAEIFRHANYGVVADARLVLQELIRLFEEAEDVTPQHNSL
jgi:electron transfer flavoprotein alpha subunit